MRQKHNKDCLQTVLSNGLDIDYDIIPKFYENDETWQQDYNDWLKENNLFRIILDIKYSEEMIFPYCSVQPVLIIGVLTKKEREYDHAVILTFKDHNILMSDPKPDSDYDLTNLVQVEMIFKGNHKKRHTVMSRVPEMSEKGGPLLY
jgi:hypothetical protein